MEWCDLAGDSIYSPFTAKVSHQTKVRAHQVSVSWSVGKRKVTIRSNEVSDGALHNGKVHYWVSEGDFRSDARPIAVVVGLHCRTRPPDIDHWQISALSPQAQQVETIRSTRSGLGAVKVAKVRSFRSVKQRRYFKACPDSGGCPPFAFISRQLDQMASEIGSTKWPVGQIVQKWSRRRTLADRATFKLGLGESQSLRQSHSLAHHQFCPQNGLLHWSPSPLEEMSL